MAKSKEIISMLSISIINESYIYDTTKLVELESRLMSDLAGIYA